jgi:hypothetical protein
VIVGSASRWLDQQRRLDFVVAFQPENYVIFRSTDPNALSKVCRQLRWNIVHDTALAHTVCPLPGVSPEPSVCAKKKDLGLGQRSRRKGPAYRHYLKFHHFWALYQSSTSFRTWSFAMP